MLGAREIQVQGPTTYFLCVRGGNDLTIFGNDVYVRLSFDIDSPVLVWIQRRIRRENSFLGIKTLSIPKMI